MLLRIVGVVLFCLGVMLAALALSNALHGASLAALSAGLAKSENRPFDASTWLAHWRVTVLAAAGVGGAIAVAGAAIALGRRWGLLLLGTVLLFAAVAPWVLQWLGLIRYRFERPGLSDTTVLVAFAVLAIWGYFLRPEGRTDA